MIHYSWETTRSRGVVQAEVSPGHSMTATVLTAPPTGDHYVYMWRSKDVSFMPGQNLQ